MLWIIRDTNFEATEYYLDILEKSAVTAGQKVRQVDGTKYVKSGNKDDTYLVTTLFDALKIYLSGKKRIIIWFQGVFSEESYMKHNSKLRKFILEYIEKYILKKAQFIFFVSEEMKRFYSQRFKVNLEGKYYVMPCFNSNIRKDAFIAEDKYNNNIFCYIGSLSVWQEFGKILDCYKKIEQSGFPGTKLLVLTREKQKAQELVKQAGIKNYCVDYVPIKRLSKALTKAKFGFILRDNVIVNRVATPTKISTYIANGLIPIYSECLVDFNNVAKNMKYVIPFNDITFINDIKKFVKRNINANEVYDEYLNIFKNYYNVEYHVEQISVIMKLIIR